MAIRNLNEEDNSQSYFDWLCELVGAAPNNDFIVGLRQLHSASFNVLVPHDDNRAADGIELRHVYEQDTGNRLSRAEALRPCSLLEMIIGISKRFAFDVSEQGFDPDIKNAFWILISNLGLKKNHTQNPAIIRKLNERTYAPNGVGGLFPLKRSIKDQRDVELWYQMQAYLMENY